MTARISAFPAELRVVPGSETSVTMTVRNVGSLVDRFTFAVEGNAAPWTEAIPPQLPLLPGAEGTIELRFAPPRVARTQAGEQPIVLRAVSEKDSVAPASVEGVIEVAPFFDTSARIVPQNSRGRFKTDVQLRLQNDGNDVVTPKVVASDADGALTFDIEPPSMRVPPSGSMSASIRIGVKRVRFRGKVRPLTFQVDVACDDVTIPLAGTFMHKPVVTRWQFVALSLLALTLWIVSR